MTRFGPSANKVTLQEKIAKDSLEGGSLFSPCDIFGVLTYAMCNSRKCDMGRKCNPPSIYKGIKLHFQYCSGNIHREMCGITIISVNMWAAWAE